MPAPPSDFDFMLATFDVEHRRLRERLVGCTDWDVFGGTSTTFPILGGWGLVEDNTIDLPSGPYRAVGLRSFDPTSRAWAIWWLDGRSPHSLDVPVVGRFDADGVGTFEARDVLDGRPIVVRFTWSGIAAGSPRWEQAFSADDGATWETNWTMTFARAD